MRNKVKRTLSFLLTFVMLCSLLPAMALAKEPEGRYEEVAGVEALVEDATVKVFTTKGAGTIELTGINAVETTFPQGTGYRQYTATANEGWVFDTWRFEQLYKGEDLGNRHDYGWGKRYSFTNSGDDWKDPYTEGNATISVNRLLTAGETVFNKLSYKVYADFNPTITATAGENGTISGSDKPVEVEYGKDQAFDIKADTGYIIDTITVDGKDIAEGKNEESYTYTFENVIAPHTIDVTFRVKPDPGQCIVSYVVQGDIPADYQAPEADIVKEGETYTVKSVPEPVVDYEFSGWYDEDQNIVTEFTVTGDVTLTGIWTYTGEKDLWDTVYGTIRVYMDEGTEADFNNLPGLNLNKQVRLYSEKYLTDGYRLCGYEPINDFWYTTNAKDVTARDISEIVLAKDKLVGSSEKISIPMTGNDDYQVTVSEGEDKFGLIPYTYLKIEISKKEPVEETVTLTYDANGGTGAPETATVNKNTEVTLDSTTTPTHAEADGKYVTFAGWSNDEAVKGVIYEKGSEPMPVDKVTVGETDVTVYAVWVYGDPVDPVDPPEPPTWELSKDKTATALDSNYNSKVTLSLPAGDYPQTVDVVFTVDCTSVLLYNYTGIIKEIEKIADELVGKDINLNVGLVGFGHESKVYLPLTNITEENVDAVMEEVKTTISNDRDWLKNNGGTNIQKGILTGRELLDNSNTGALPNDQYFILMTDGAGFWYNNANGETVCTAHRDSNQSLGNMDANNDVGGPTRINDSMYLRAVNEGKTFGDFIAEQGAAIEKSAERSFTTEGAKSAGELAYTTQDVQNYDVYPYLNMERGTYFAAKALQDVAAEGYSVITIGYNYNKFGLTSLNAVSKGFREWTAEVGSYYTASMFNVQDAFEGVRDEMIYLLDAGSQVVDIIGQGKDNKGNDYNFDVANLDNMTITVGGVELNKVKIQSEEFPGSTTYGFFEGEIADGKYDFVVTYYPDGVADADGETREHFVWSINVPVGNFAPAQFSYDVHLTNPQKAKGEYKVETNVEAVLTPVDSNETVGSTETFPVPELTYEVKGGGSTTEHLMTVIVEGKGNVVVKDVQTVGANDTEVVEIPFGVEKQKFEMEAADGWKLDKVEVTINGKTENLGDVDKYEMDESLIDGAVLKAVFVKDNDGGSGGGGSHRPNNKPDETPEALNGDDHFDYVVGYSDGLVHPERNITRAEVASIFFRLLQDDVREKNLTDQNPFNDVFTDDWFNVAVSTMYDMDIVYGRDNNNFDPNAYITRAEFAAIAARFDSEGYSGENLFTDIDGHWAANQINRAAEKGWISGYPDGTFGPDRYITRAEAVTMINRVLNRLPESADALHEDMNVFPDNMDTTAWYYLAIQEATSSHEYEKDKDGVYETWTDVLPDRDWAQYLKLN
ncbi:MAG: S-layer homology domain-containing protein [Anaerotignum lactatifermentans]|uniref:S-layer homology domain-containing protein n=1 Tax=Anaerotignum lactatifermentans TaxID=160404 RepID=UPI003999C785